MQTEQTASEQLLNEVKERLASALFRLENALQASQEKDQQTRTANAQVLQELNGHITKLETVLNKKKA